MPSVILLTGSNSGFGRLTAEALARRGHTVFAAMRGVNGKNAQAARELREWAAREKASLHVVELDVTDDASVSAAVKSVLAQAKRLDVVVNNAGVFGMGQAEAFTPEHARTLFEVNYFGVQRLNRAVIPHLRAQGSGLLVQISSTVARFIMPFMAHYSATKAAVETLAESYRYELSPFGIDSTIVEPGAFPTDIVTKSLAPDDTQRLADYGPMAQLPQKMGEGLGQLFAREDGPRSQEVADAVVRLIELPAGQRPLRTVVDRFTGAGAEAVNATHEQVEARVLEGLGMQGMKSVAAKVA